MAYTNNNNTIYTVKDIELFLDIIKNSEIVKEAATGKKATHKVYNIPSSFDIEASSWVENGSKRACMYIWQFGVNGYVMIGRTWDEFEYVINYLNKYLEADLYVYIHNLAYEYQWIKNRFKFDDVFFTKERQPAYARVEKIVFKCSYLLSGKSLENVGKDLTKYKVSKLDTLDYSLIRTKDTYISPEEMEYCINDVKVVMSYIQELIEREGNITKLPMTATGFVRRLCREQCLKDKYYVRTMKELKLTSEVYEMCKRSIAGGWTHSNAMWAGKTVKNVASYDFITSYIACAVAFKHFPMSHFIERQPDSQEKFDWYIKNKCCLFNVKFEHIRLKNYQCASIISRHKCNHLINCREDNGKVFSADSLELTINEIDYEDIKTFYDWDKMSIGKFYVARRDYLPTALVDVMLTLYEQKTKLKGVEGEEVNYDRAKALLNAIYGMMITDVFKQSDSIEEYNKSFKRFNYYPWGMWICSLSRRQLFTGINELGPDFVYSDTDSIKFLHPDQHLDYIEKYNSYITNQLEKAMDYHCFSHDRIRPKNIFGQEKVLGTWDCDGLYDEFKTLRSKAYMTRKDDTYGLTLAGVNKKDGLKYLLLFDNPIEAFKDGITFPAEYSGKKTHTYIEYEIEGEVVDYQGHTTHYSEKSSVNISNTEYYLTREQDFLDFCKYIEIKIAKRKRGL